MTFDDCYRFLSDRLAKSEMPEEKLKAVAEGLAAFYGVRPHEIGLFNVNAKKHEITFIWPLSMAKVGHIPLNAVNSLVAKTANDRISTLDNTFARSRHLFMFEHMLAEKSERIPVQKIMSVPIANDETVAGVIQVTRKADSPQEAGEDFSRKNLADLELIAALLAQHQI